MRSSKPPALATWLVEHMVPGGKNEALAGDLLEQFIQGRSAGWYWRQAIGAIAVGCSKEFRTLGAAVGVTVVWTSALTVFYGRFWAGAQMLALTTMAMRHGWDWRGAGFLSSCFFIGSLTAFNALPVALAASMYLGLEGTFTVRRFLRGLSAGLLAMAISFRLSFVWSPILWYRPRFVGHLVFSLPLFSAVLISMWAARPNHDERRNLRPALP
jgi:hypothetical protein